LYPPLFSVLVTLILSLLWPNHGYAQEIVGRASAINGDTIEIHSQRVRLYGIDAPESSQHCKAENGKLWRCGQRAALYLSDYIGESNVSCQAKDKDRYGRTVAVCYKGKQTSMPGWCKTAGQWLIESTARTTLMKKA
jgi:endonuclease YncB( thermonuclease family)